MAEDTVNNDNMMNGIWVCVTLVVLISGAALLYYLRYVHSRSRLIVWFGFLWFTETAIRRESKIFIN